MKHQWWWLIGLAALSAVLLWLQVVHAQTIIQPGGSVAVVCVPNPTPTATPTVSPPTPTMTPTWTASPTATPTAAPPTPCIGIIAPPDGATVSGSIYLQTTDTCEGVWYEQLWVDSIEAGADGPGELRYDTTQVPNGIHIFQVDSHSKNPGGTVLGSAMAHYDVENASPSPTPTGSPSTSPSATPSAQPTTIGTLNITSGGTAANPKVYDGTGVKAGNIIVNASNVIVQNYEVSNQANKYGVDVKGVSNVTVQNLYVHELCREGIWLNGGSSNVKVLNNRIWQASMAGVHIDGTNHLVDGNEVWDTVQYPKQVGGIYSGCTNQSGADADCMRWFGSGHTVSNNYCHDIANDWGSARNKDPHVDCIQTWGPLKDSHYTHNRCLWNNATGTIDREFCEHEQLNQTTTTNLLFDYNLFSGGRDGCMWESPITKITFDHNTVVGVLHKSINLYSSGNVVTNNINYDVGNGDGAWCIPSGNTVTNNNRYNPSGRYGTYCSSYPETRLDPQFVNVPPNFNDYWKGDYHLRPTTPVPTLGAYPLNLDLEQRLANLEALVRELVERVNRIERDHDHDHDHDHDRDHGVELSPQEPPPYIGDQP